MEFRHPLSHDDARSHPWHDGEWRGKGEGEKVGQNEMGEKGQARRAREGSEHTCRINAAAVTLKKVEKYTIEFSQHQLNMLRKTHLAKANQNEQGQLHLRYEKPLRKKEASGLEGFRWGVGRNRVGRRGREGRWKNAGTKDRDRGSERAAERQPAASPPSVSVRRSGRKKAIQQSPSPVAVAFLFRQRRVRLSFQQFAVSS